MSAGWGRKTKETGLLFGRTAAFCTVKEIVTAEALPWGLFVADSKIKAADGVWRGADRYCLLVKAQCLPQGTGWEKDSPASATRSQLSEPKGRDITLQEGAQNL